MKIAELICQIVEAKIIVKPSNDPRSYRIDSSKLLNTGFKPMKNVKDAIKEIAALFESGKIQDKPEYYNLNWMKKHIIL